MKSRSLISQALGLAFLSLVATARAEEPADANAWLQKMVDAVHHLSYEASFIYVHEGRIESMRVLHTVVDGRERERLTHLNGPVREIYRDGDQLVARTPAGDHDAEMRRVPVNGLMLADVAKLERYYDASLQGESRIAGRMGQHVLLRSKDGYRYGYRLWLDKDTGLLLRSDLIDERNEAIEQIQMVSLYLRDAIPEQELVPASREDLVETPLTEAPAPLLGNDDGWQVAWVPEGFSLTRRERQTYDHAPADHWMFNDGLSSVSVYIQAKNDDAQSSDVMRRGGTTVLEIGRKGYRVTVVGEIPLVAAQRIAASVARVAPPSRAPEPVSSSAAGH